MADRVELITRRAGLPAEDAVRWESDGRGSYTLEPATRPGRGTTVVLHLRDGEDELLNGYRLRSIIQKYSDHISLPIVMPAEGGQTGSGSGDAAGGQEGCPGGRGGRAGQPGFRAVGPAEERDQRPGLPGLLPPPHR